MGRITRHDYETLQCGLRDLYAHHDLDSLARAAVGLVGRLVPSEQTTYNEIDPVHKRLLAYTEPVDHQPQLDHLAHRWERHMHQHPLLAHFLTHPADGPRKISDFLTDAQFQALELYTEFFRELGLRYQMVTTMPAPPPLAVGIACNRAGRDFSERDRSVLQLLQPHLRQAYDNAALVTQLTEEVGLAHGLLERLERGVVVIDGAGRVQRVTPMAVRFALEQFSDDPHADLSRKLPDPLLRWALAQIAILQRDHDAHPAPLILTRPQDGRLILRLVTDPRPDRFSIIMRRVDPPDSPQPLRGLGLTQRQSQVLLHLVRGLSNSEIGFALSISERTVHKHLENIYRVLAVNDRAAAATRAMEWLRF